MALGQAQKGFASVVRSFSLTRDGLLGARERVPNVLEVSRVRSRCPSESAIRLTTPRSIVTVGLVDGHGAATSSSHTTLANHGGFAPEET
jgi:hypothetical protein